jgi:Zn-dependent peptidase ImmA (M78 family)
VDEFTTVNRARDLVAKVRPKSIPVPIEAYVDHVGAVLRRDETLDADEPGWSFCNKGKQYICVNANDPPERQRFTICHELAHIVLGLPSEHGQGAWWSYTKRSVNEISCDVFAAELLLPYGLFKPLAERAVVSLSTIDKLAEKFEASRMATGSRFAAVVSIPCAFVLSEGGKVRYASRSRTMRDMGAWLQPGMTFPHDSMSHRLRAGDTGEGAEEIAADSWFSDWQRGGMLNEEARHLPRWDQTLTLLWMDDDEFESRESVRRPELDDQGLRELDGILPWPGRKRRK